MSVPLLIPPNRLRLDAALDWFHTGHRDHAGFDWIAERVRRNHPVRMALAGGTLKAYLLTEKGYQVIVPPEFWAGRFLWSEAYSSALVKVRIDGNVVAGYLVVDADAFAALVEAGDAPAAHRSSPSPVDYVPPYLAYMLELAERFDLTEDYDFSRKSLAAWIMVNANELPPDLEITKNKAGMIVTFLSVPRFETGGNRPAVSKGRDPDPCKPFNGISYPKPRQRP